MNKTKSNVLIKVMTSTPNSSFIPMENHHGKTAHNAINQRKSKRRSQRTPLPLLVNFILYFIYKITSLFSGNSRYKRRNNGVLMIGYNCSCIFFTVCIYSK